MIGPVPLRDPLTFEELRAIGKYCRTPAVRALLWEIYRLQGLLERVEQLQSMMGDDGRHMDTMFSQVLSMLRQALDREPCIQHLRRERKEFLYPDGKAPRKTPRTW